MTPHRWMFVLPRVRFDRDWSLGSAVFRAPAAAAAAVSACADQRSVHRSWAIAHERACAAIGDWTNSSTIEVRANDEADAIRLVAESLATLRLFMREVVQVNVDSHRIGLTGEVDHAIRDFLVFYDDLGRVAPGWKRIDGPVDFTFTARQLDDWDADQRVQWLSTQLGLKPELRSLAGRRMVSAIEVLDRAFLTTDPLVRVILSAVAIECVYANSSDPLTPVQKTTGSLRVAARVAFLSCGAGCGVERPACPYVLGFKGYDHLWEVVEEWAARGKQWCCSAFLDIARPAEMDEAFQRLSVFGARNEAVHQGRTSMGPDDAKWMRWQADAAVKAFLAWVTERGDGTIDDLDAEIATGVARLGVLRPDDPPPDPETS